MSEEEKHEKSPEEETKPEEEEVREPPKVYNCACHYCDDDSVVPATINCVVPNFFAMTLQPTGDIQPIEITDLREKWLVLFTFPMVATTVAPSEIVAFSENHSRFAEINCEILALTYHDGQVAREREEEFDKILADYPDIVVTKNEVGIPGYYQDGMDYATAWLASRPAGEANYAVWGSWDDPALGAIASLKQMGRDDVKVYGENGNADAIQAIRDGWMTATAWQDGYGEGVAAIEAIEEMNTQGDAFEKGARELEAVLITLENVEDFVAEHPEAIENVQ